MSKSCADNKCAQHYLLQSKVGALELALENADCQITFLARENAKLKELIEYYRSGTETRNCGIQTDDNGYLCAAANTSCSISDVPEGVFPEVHNTLINRGYAFDNVSCMYFSIESGYYFDVQSQCYYHPSTQKYYYYDETTSKYETVRQTSEYDEAMYFYKYFFKKRHYRPWAAQYCFPTDGSLEPVALETIVDLCDFIEDGEKQMLSRCQLDEIYSMEEGELTIEEEEIRWCNVAVEQMERSCEHGVLLQSTNHFNSLDLELFHKWNQRYISDDSSEDEALNIPNSTPCIRAIVRESDCLLPNSLHIITMTGAMFGRDEDQCDIVIPCSTISKRHCSIAFEQTKGSYCVVDENSRNGTWLNDKLIDAEDNPSSSDTKVTPIILRHEDRLRLGSTTFCLHIHKQDNTCQGCEPGLLSSDNKHDGNDVCFVKKTIHRRENKNLKRKWGIEGPADVPFNKKYTNRAENRRKTKGSDTPSRHCAPPTSIHRALSTDNKGFQMLEKMGWKTGTALGRTDSGITEPILSVSHLGSAGLGSTSAAQASLDTAADMNSMKKRQQLLKTIDRYSRTMLPAKSKNELTFVSGNGKHYKGAKL